VFNPLIFWPGFLGIVVLLIGLFVALPELRSQRGLDKLIALGPVLFAAPLATFGGEHLSNARALAQGVPAWMPAHLFFAYFVGIALEAAALSLALKKYLRLSSLLLAILFAIFVATIHAPNVAATHFKQRIFWVVATRDFSFGLGALALFAALVRAKDVVAVVRFVMAAILVFYGVQHLLHPEFSPGVPLSLLTPAWVPMRILLSYTVGACLAIWGFGLVFRSFARVGATLVGLLMTLLTLCLYTPILFTVHGTEPVILAINYIFDTMLFGGTYLLLAQALPCQSADSRPIAT